MKKILYPFLLLLGFFLIVACGDDPEPEPDPILFDGTPFLLEYGPHLPPPNLPTDNALTEQKIALGRMLFFDPLLSKDGSQACADCHRQSNGFSDTAQFSIGVVGLPGGRQAMPIFNMAWHSNQFFWDGRASLLRDQALLPIQDALEMDETLDNVIDKLSDSQMYLDQFKRSFDSQEITAEKMALAMEQFMLSIVSFESKFDKFLSGEASLTASEARGKELFEAEYNPFFPEVSGADCAHCHGGYNFENDQYMNNGLDTDVEFSDIGREEVTMEAHDRAKFKVPSLRNVAVTAPYMHDGRFQTLEEVIDHYNEGIKASTTTDFTVANTIPTGLMLDDQDKTDLINFLKTLTDLNFLGNPDYQTPF